MRVNQGVAQALVVSRGAFTTIRGNRTGISADSDADWRKKGRKIRVFHQYGIRMASVPTDVEQGRASGGR